MELKSKFIRWYHDEFVHTDLFHEMESTVEGSPWHRESSVGVHTNMVVSEYLSIVQNREWNRDHLIGALAVAFHDVGKPYSMQEKHSASRGTYYSFAGHEYSSVRLMEDYLASNWSWISEELGLLPIDIYRIGWLIHHHMAYKVQKAHKLSTLAHTLWTLFPNVYLTLQNVIWADQLGRVSDHREDTINKLYEWENKFCDIGITPLPEVTQDDLTVQLLIGASGSGKSTHVAHFPEYLHYSWDALRLLWYTKPNDFDNDEERYEAAFEASTKDKKFGEKVNAAFLNALDGRRNVIVDNTNLTDKRRRFFATEARRKGYKVVGVLFPVSLHDLETRSYSRKDKSLHWDIVKKQYFSLQYPNLGELDDVWVVDANL